MWQESPQQTDQQLIAVLDTIDDPPPLLHRLAAIEQRAFDAVARATDRLILEALSCSRFRLLEGFSVLRIACEFAVVRGPVDAGRFCRLGQPAGLFVDPEKCSQAARRSLVR